MRIVGPALTKPNLTQHSGVPIIYFETDPDHILISVTLCTYLHLALSHTWHCVTWHSVHLALGHLALCHLALCHLAIGHTFGNPGVADLPPQLLIPILFELLVYVYWSPLKTPEHSICLGFIFAGLFLIISLNANLRIAKLSSSCSSSQIQLN